MNRIGFEEVPPRNAKFDKHRKRFCKRLELAHSKIAKRFKAGSFSWDFGNNYHCECGKQIVSNWCVRAFVHREFSWPESLLHHIKYHKVAPTKAFYVMILKVTEKYIPLNELEKKTVNKYISGQ